MTSLFSNEKINAGRQLEVDMARAFAILTMVQVHLFERMHWTTPLSDWGAAIVEFAGGPLSAPIFMTAMGVGLAYSKNQTAGGLAARGKILIKQGYVLGFLRYALITLVLYTMTNDDSWLVAGVKHMLFLDILQFAGVAFLLFALLKKLHAKPRQILALAIVMECIATIMPPLVPDAPFPAGILGYLFYQSPETCFPLFSWFIYPAVGYCFALLLQHTIDKTKFYIRVFGVSVGVFAVLTALLLALRYDITMIFLDHGYYAQGLVRVCWILPIAGMTYSLLYFVSLCLHPGRLQRLVQFMSSKVNDIYMCQWILITWLCDFFLAEAAGTPALFGLLIFIVLVLSVWFPYLKLQASAHFKNKPA